MINNEIIESYLNCKYKAHRKLNNEQGIKTEFKILQEDQLSVGKTEFYKCLSEKYSETNLLKGYNFGNNGRILKNVLLKDEKQYESRIVDSEEEVIRLTNRGYDCQMVGVNKWLMKRKSLGKTYI